MKTLGQDSVNALALQAYCEKNAAPADRESFDALPMDHWFALEFNMDMLSPEEVLRAKNHTSKNGKPLLQVLRDEGDKCLILTTKALLLSASAHVSEWGDALVLGGDGIWNIARSGQTCVVAMGSFCNYSEAVSGGCEHQHAFRPFGLVWSFSENASMVCAQFAALRAYMDKLGLHAPREVAMWNSDGHLSYTALREVFFPNAVPLPCGVHIQRLMLELKRVVGDERWQDAREDLETLKHAQNDCVFTHVLQDTIDKWSSLPGSAAVHVTRFFERLLHRPHFSMGQSRFPGFAPDNQSIESFMAVLRQATGGRASRLKEKQVLYHTIPRLMRDISHRCMDNVNGHVLTVSTFVGAMTVTTAQQLEALQVASEDPALCVHAYTTRDGDVLVMSAFQQTNRRNAVTGARNMWSLRCTDITEEFAITFAAMMNNQDHATWSLSREEVRSCVLVRRLSSDDFPQLPQKHRDHLLKTGFSCTCSHFMQQSQCGHVVQAKHLHDNRFGEHGNRLYYKNLGANYLTSPNKSYRKRRYPGGDDQKPKKQKKSETEFKVNLTPSPRIKTKAAEQRFMETALSPSQRIDALKSKFHAKPGQDAGSMSMVQALWTMAREEQDLDSFDSDAKQWATMARQRGVNHENITRYIEFLKNARSSHAALQWHPTFFMMYFGVRSPSDIPFWFYPDNLMSEEAMKEVRLSSDDEVCFTTYAPVKMKLTTSAIFKDELSNGWLDDAFINAMADLIQHTFPSTVILPTHVSECMSSVTSTTPAEEQFHNAFELCGSGGRSLNWFLKKDIFIPWFVGNHWYLYHVHVDTQTSKITTTSYDSGARTMKKGGPQSDEKKNAHAWLKGFISYSLRAAGRVSARQFRSAPTFVRHFGKAPLQKDGCSCGIYMLLNMIVLSFGVKLDETTYTPMSEEAYVRSLFRSALLRAKSRDMHDLYAQQAEGKSTRMNTRSQGDA